MHQICLIAYLFTFRSLLHQSDTGKRTPAKGDSCIKQGRPVVSFVPPALFHPKGSLDQLSSSRATPLFVRSATARIRVGIFVPCVRSQNISAAWPPRFPRTLRAQAQATPLPYGNVVRAHISAFLRTLRNMDDADGGNCNGHRVSRHCH